MKSTSKRLLSLDILRGITISGMILVNNPGSWQYVYAPLKHAEWNGLTPTDLVYPFFMFIMGVAIYLSLHKFNKNDAYIWTKVARRTILLFGVGLALCCFSMLCQEEFAWGKVRIMGVMQRLALAYAGGSILTLIASPKHYLSIAGGILIAYIVILQCFNGYAQDGSNLISIIDVQLLGASHLITQTSTSGSFPFEPEGLLSTLPCWAHVLIGSYIGYLIVQLNDHKEKVRKIALAGIVLLFCGFLLQYLDPINKKLWTSSYTLVTSGAASLLLALLIEIIDVYGKKRWTHFFEAFGVNPLFMYCVAWIVSSLFSIPFIPWNEEYISVKGELYNHIFLPIVGDYLASLIYAILFIGLIWCIGYPLYRKHIYIKL